MTETSILLSLLPFIFLAFVTRKKTRIFVEIFAVILAAASVGYWVYIRRDAPFSWIPMGALLCLFVQGAVEQKKFRSLTALGVLFIAQAMLCTSSGAIVLLVAFADVFLSVELFLSSRVEEKHRAVQSIYQSAWTFLPVATGVLLQLQGEWMTVAVAVTVVMRLFSWPVNHWIYEINSQSRQFMIYLGGISCFALWHIQPVEGVLPWPAIWLAVAVVFSVGAKYLELYGALVLGLFSFSPVLGVLAMTLWPLFAHQGKLTLLIALLAGAAGSLISEVSVKVLVQQAAFAAAAVAGMALGRVFAGTSPVKVKWYWELTDFIVAGIWVGILIWFSPPEVTLPMGPGLAFGSGFLVILAAGLALHKKRPKWLKPAPSLSPHFFSRDFVSLKFLAEKTGGPITVPQTRARAALFSVLESEVQLVFLLGFLGAVLLWGLR